MADRPRVFVFTPLDETGASHAEMEEAGCDLSLGEPKWRVEMGATPDIVLEAAGANVAATVGAIIRGFTFDGPVFDRLPELRLVSKYTIGYDDVDLVAATERGILVTHSPTEANWGGVAEGTMAMILGLLKKLRERDRHVKNGGWRDDELLATYLGARQDGYPGLTVGIVGLGRIGSRVADLLAPWRVNLLCHDPYVEDARFAHHNVKPVDLETLFREADVVTLHCNLTAETQNIIDKYALSLMKPSAILINSARGPLIDEDALFHALYSEQLAGAALDVFDIEPLPPQSPLLGLGEKIMVSPHMVSNTKGAGLALAVPWATKAVLDALKGEVPRYVVNPDAVPKWRERFGGKALI